MASKIQANVAASITELKKNPMAVIAAGQGAPVAILNRNTPGFYCIPLEVYQAMVERLSAHDRKLNTALAAAEDVMDENGTLLHTLA